MVFEEQYVWWEDMIYLANEVFEGQNEISMFFNEGEAGNRNWNKTNDEIVGMLMEIAKSKGIEIDKEDYENLKFE